MTALVTVVILLAEAVAGFESGVGAPETRAFETRRVEVVAGVEEAGVVVAGTVELALVLVASFGIVGRDLGGT